MASKVQHWEKPPWYSFYEKNNYGELFYSLMRVYQPEKVVELGTKAGYSAYHIARGLNANGKGSLDCYDLWEKYQFRSVPKSVAQKNLEEFKDIINLKSGDAIGADRNYEMIDILHVDLSNEGGILEKIIPSWIGKVKDLIIIEGGSRERDKINWMIKYKKVPIKKWIEDFTSRYNHINYFNIKPFPSITILKKLTK